MDLSKLKGVIPGCVLVELPFVLHEFDIDTPLRAAHFLAQCAHESANFTRTEENLNYSLEALLRVFPKYFNPGNVEPYVHRPILIASKVYANRMGNGEERTADGWNFRGRGYMQLTGKDNYAAFGKVIGEDLTGGNELHHPAGNDLPHPANLVAEKYPLESAAWFWKTHRLNERADGGSDQQVVADITRIVNGGYNGLEDRQERFVSIYSRIK